MANCEDFGYKIYGFTISGVAWMGVGAHGQEEGAGAHGQEEDGEAHAYKRGQVGTFEGGLNPVAQSLPPPGYATVDND